MKLNELVSTLNSNQELIVNEWVKEQLSTNSVRKDIVSEKELKNQSIHFYQSLSRALENSTTTDIKSQAWNETRDFLSSLSRTRAAQGFSPSETAIFIFALKTPLFEVLRKTYSHSVADLADATAQLTQVLDRLGLFTMETYQKGREELISRQQSEMLELSTPVVQLWDGILALPMIGTLDSSRTQVVMETLLQRILETESRIAIIDITGVPTVDTLVAQHLLKTVAAARLMGAECLISGIRPQIAATIVHLGVDLGGIATKASLADAFKLALEKTDQMIGDGL